MEKLISRKTAISKTHFVSDMSSCTEHVQLRWMCKSKRNVNEIVECIIYEGNTTFGVFDAKVHGLWQAEAHQGQFLTLPRGSLASLVYPCPG